MLAAASPLLRVLLLEEENRGDEVQELCCPELEPKQAFQLLQFIYQGQVEGLDVAAAEDLVRAVGHLQITGLLPGRAITVCEVSVLTQFSCRVESIWPIGSKLLKYQNSNY